VKLFLVQKILVSVNLTIYLQPKREKKIMDKVTLRTKENYTKEN
jgi:hypothetical protein